MNGLREHLQKSEIEYIASHGGGHPETFKWDDDIENHIKRIGFRIKRRYTCDGDKWVTTTSKISVCLDGGYIVKEYKSPTII